MDQWLYMNTNDNSTIKKNNTTERCTSGNSQRQSSKCQKRKIKIC